MKSSPSFRFLGSDHDGVGKTSDESNTRDRLACGFCKRGESLIVLADEALQLEQYLVGEALFGSTPGGGKPRCEPGFPKQRLQPGPTHAGGDLEQQQRGVVPRRLLLDGTDHISSRRVLPIRDDGQL